MTKYIFATGGAVSPDNRLVEAVKRSEREFHVGAHYRPERNNRLNKPHPCL